MALKQISVFLENNSGRLAEVTKTLAKVDINIRAISIADTADFGILRLIVNRNEEALNALNDAGFTTRTTEVEAIEIDDTPGSLAQVMEIFKQHQVNIEYLYASLEGASGKAVVILKMQDPEQGARIIGEHGLSLAKIF